MDVRVFGQDFPERRQQDLGGGKLRRRQADGSGRLLAQFAERGEISIHLGEFGAHAEEQPFSGLSRCDAPRRPVQQSHAEPLLKIPDDLTERGLRHAELRRGAREAALSRHCEEGEEIAGILSIHS